MTKAVRPLRPPSPTPEVLSIKVTMVLVPSMAPTVVPMASTRKACFRQGIFPSLSTIPALVITPTSVPMVSNISTKRKVNTTMSISLVNICFHSNWQKMGSMEGGALNTPSNRVIPIGIPINVVSNIPRSRAPLTFLTSSTAVNTRPMIPNRAGPDVISPSPSSVTSLFTIIRAFCRPMKEMNRPIPAPMACFKVSGMALTIFSRRLETVSRIKMIPSIKTAVSANCQVYPIVRQTV